MKGEKKKSQIINLFNKFWFIFLFSLLLILYYSLQEFHYLPENFPRLVFEPKDIISAAFTFIGICIAFNGLNTWKEQLRGKYDFDLACQSMRDISRIRIAYINFSVMWFFFPISKDKNIVRLYIHDSYLQKLNDLRFEIINFRTKINEIYTIWNDFPRDHLDTMLIKANTYLASAEKFISLCQTEIFISNNSSKHVTFNIAKKDDPIDLTPKN
jgi:hypothetical protein